MLGPEGHVKSGQLSSHQHAAVDLPASLFHQINDHTSIGIFFMLYETTTLFPVDDEESVNSNETEVGSHVLSVTVGSGLNFQDLLHNITILLRLTSNNVRVAINMILITNNQFVLCGHTVYSYWFRKVCFLGL